jgi:Cohesin domain
MAKLTTTQFIKKHKIILFVGLCVIIVIIAILSFTSHQNEMVPDMGIVPTMYPDDQKQPRMQQGAVKTDPMQASTLSVIKKTNAVDVMIDTNFDTVTGIQLGFTYDPEVISNVQVIPGTFLSNQVVLQNVVDQEKGIIRFATAIKPNTPPVKGKGVVATITYTVVDGTKQTELTFTKRTQISASGMTHSALKDFTSVTLP